MTPPASHYSTVIARFLESKRRERGLSLRGLASETGLSLSTVVRLLDGDRELTVDYLSRICAALDVDVHTAVQEADSEV